MLHTIAHYAMYVTGGCTTLAIIGAILVAAAALDLYREGKAKEIYWGLPAVMLFLIVFWGGATYGLTLL